MKQKFIDCMMQFSHDAWGGDSIPSTEKSFAEVFDVLVKSGFIQEWQPIETVPVSRILVYVEEGFIEVVNFDGSAFYDDIGDEIYGLTPTRWQPLPQPPKP